MNPLDLIGAAANHPKDTMEQPNGQARSGEGGGNGSESPGHGGDAESATLYLSTCDVRAVRRETRQIQGGASQDVVVVDFVASDESIDSHDSIVVCDHDLRRFNKNPVLLWSHNRDKDHLPIGRCENTRIENKTLLSTAVFFMRTDFQRDIAEAYARGECRMFSIGFYPDTYELKEIDGEEVLILSNNCLIEISAVPVGSNENALAKKALDAARVRARAANLPNPPAPSITRARPPSGAPKDLTMKTFPIDVRAHRASPATPAACPACNEALAVQLTNVPEHDEKAVADLTTRATTAEGKLTEMERSLALATSELDGAKVRLAAIEPELAAARSAAEKHQTERIASEIDKRVGVRIFAAERATEIKLATLLLADRVADPEKPGSTLGEKAFAARLAEIDARPDIGLLGRALTGTDQSQNHGAGKDPKARDLAAEIDALIAA